MSTLVHLLYQVTWDAIADGSLGDEDRFSLHLLNIVYSILENVLLYYFIIIQRWDELSYNRFIQDHCKLITLDKISTFLKPPFSHLVHKVECLVFELFPFQMNYFCILFSSLIISVGKLVTGERCMIYDIAKVLKIVIFPSRVKFRILHNFSTFSIFRTCMIKFSFVSRFLL